MTNRSSVACNLFMAASPRYPTNTTRVIAYLPCNFQMKIGGGLWSHRIIEPVSCSASVRVAGAPAAGRPPCVAVALRRRRHLANRP